MPGWFDDEHSGDDGMKEDGLYQICLQTCFPNGCQGRPQETNVFCKCGEADDEQRKQENQGEIFVIVDFVVVWKQ